VSAVQLLAAAVLLLGLGGISAAVVIIGLLRRVRALEAATPTVAQVIFARAILEGRVTHQPRPAASHVNLHIAPPITAPSRIAVQPDPRKVWNGQGWQA
jgi:hypothetical protein